MAQLNFCWKEDSALLTDCFFQLLSSLGIGGCSPVLAPRLADEAVSLSPGIRCANASLLECFMPEFSCFSFRGPSFLILSSDQRMRGSSDERGTRGRGPGDKSGFPHTLHLFPGIGVWDLLLRQANSMPEIRISEWEGNVCQRKRKERPSLRCIPGIGMKNGIRWKGDAGSRSLVTRPGHKYQQEMQENVRWTARTQEADIEIWTFGNSVYI